MRHFVVFLVLGVTALVAGMTLAARFAIPTSDATETATKSQPSVVSSHELAMPETPDMTAISRLAKTIPDPVDLADDMPTTGEVASGAGRVFGKATRTVERYSDQAFGSTARELKHTVDQTRMPIGG